MSNQLGGSRLASPTYAELASLQLLYIIKIDSPCNDIVRIVMSRFETGMIRHIISDSLCTPSSSAKDTAAQSDVATFQHCQLYIALQSIGPSKTAEVMRECAALQACLKVKARVAVGYKLCTHTNLCFKLPQAAALSVGRPQKASCTPDKIAGGAICGRGLLKLYWCGRRQRLPSHPLKLHTCD